MSRKTSQIKFIVVAIVLLASIANAHAQPIYLSGSSNNDLYLLLKSEGFDVQRFDTPGAAIGEAGKGAAVIVTATGYPERSTHFDAAMYELAKKKKLRLYLEYTDYIPGHTMPDSVHIGTLERGVVSSAFFGKKLPEMSLLGINNCHIYSVKVSQPIISFAKVAGFDKADYGLTDTEVYPLLFRQDNALIATSCLTNFKTNRFEPVASWQTVWEQLLAWLTQQKTVTFRHWPADPHPAFTTSAVLPANARRQSVERGCEWFFNGRFLIHPSWKSLMMKYQGDGAVPLGPSVGAEYLIGDGSMGILEGHASNIYYDGSQQYRFWLRYDVQGEASLALAAAGNLTGNTKYAVVAEKLIDYTFYTSNCRHTDRNSPAYGLLGWSDTHPGTFYNDDNARLILGVIGASAYMKNERWNRMVTENILANLRTCSRQGFQGRNLKQADIEKNGWPYYNHRDYTNPHPHYESWMWACYLWMYHKTGYQPLLDKAKAAIRVTMEAYPDQWKWTNGIQQERARMVLPLAWLVRVEDTPEHRQWLDIVVSKLLENQQPNGAIREELGGSGQGKYGRTKSNKEYGLHEAPLIATNGDPVSDMLYTCNFAFFGLNEAAQATGNVKYQEAVDKLSGFLTRIQVKSDTHLDLDGAWFRAFDYNRWDYWASNADVGWGAWSTLTGWIQSWIIATQVLLENKQSYWDVTAGMKMDDDLKASLWMMDESK